MSEVVPLNVLSVEVCCAHEMVAGDLAKVLTSHGISYHYKAPRFLISEWSLPAFNFKRAEWDAAWSVIESYEQERYRE